MTLAAATPSTLNWYKDKHISDICLTGYHGDGFNHCAHFVSHVLDLTFGRRCDQESHWGRGGGVNIRVQEIFERCPQVGRWGVGGVPDPCLIFVIKAGDVQLAAHHMDNVEKKHVGIYAGGTVWHYSNLFHKVMTESPAQFSHHFDYAGSGFALFWASIQ